ncbi:hypothetical protein T265_04866 [Opisthorchis viverrini]|uniref:Uncharacterized protein n=1 Tax=Opisthorchis viverrini TaxID=6198 RepID=A0A075AG08_OPIVI|nr:hypothetical protein T265_04866 [Opisthorchis viverrini]KER28264.1 hypothetical protein T265_04866 [Opisthorchis viverrini]
MPRKFVNIIRSLYSQSSGRVGVYGELPKSFRTQSGVRQGCPLSPFLFNFVIDEIMKRTLEGLQNPGWGPRAPHCVWVETLQDMAAKRYQWRSCCQFLSRLPELSNKSWLYGSEASVLNTDVMLSMMMMRDMLVPLGPKWLEREFTVWKGRGSDPPSASRLPMSRLRQPGSIPAHVPPSCGMAARRRKGATAGWFILFFISEGWILTA